MNYSDFTCVLPCQLFDVFYHQLYSLPMRWLSPCLKIAKSIKKNRNQHYSSCKMVWQHNCFRKPSKASVLIEESPASSWFMPSIRGLHGHIFSGPARPSSIQARPGPFAIRPARPGPAAISPGPACRFDQ
jgi:hypothetical protein